MNFTRFSFNYIGTEQSPMIKKPTEELKENIIHEDEKEDEDHESAMK